MIQMLKSATKFVIVMVMMTVACTVIWGTFVTDKLYNCTDAVGFDYLQPGNWVHGRVAYVPHIVASNTMTEPDTIKQGWSLASLWCLWILFFAVSVLVSVFFARKTWIQSQSVPTLPDG